MFYTTIFFSPGSLLVYRDKFGYFHLSALSSDSAAGAGAGAAAGRPFFVTKDFDDVLRCRRTDSQHLAGCRKILSIDADTVDCDLRVRSVTVEEDEEEEEGGGGSGGADGYRLNLGTGEESRDGRADQNACPGQDELNAREEGDSVQDSLRRWITRMQNHSSDPFWMHPWPEQPLDPDDPRVDIALPFYEGRKGFPSVKVHIESSDRVLLTTQLVDGRIRAGVDPAVARLSDWRAPLRVVVDGSFATTKKSSMAGLSINTEKERDVFLIGTKLRDGAPFSRNFFFLAIFFLVCFRPPGPRSSERSGPHLLEDEQRQARQVLRPSGGAGRLLRRPLPGRKASGASLARAARRDGPPAGWTRRGN